MFSKFLFILMRMGMNRDWVGVEINYRNRGWEDVRVKFLAEEGNGYNLIILENGREVI